MIKSFRIFTLFYIGLSMIFSFQNCGQDQINLQSVVLPAIVQAKTSLSAEGCVNSVKMDPEKTKFIFVIDLSRSNIGEFYTSKYLFNGTYYDGYYFFGQNQGTDTVGARFDSISQFVNTCGNSANKDYAIIGFSGGAGEIVNLGSANTLECKNRFLNSSGVLSQLGLMKQIQNSESTYYSQFKEPSTPLLAKHNSEIIPLLFKDTNYVAATDCISSTIEADLQLANNDTTNYQVFFLSDGEAKAKITGCEETTVVDKVACYTKLMDTKLSYLMKLSSAKSKPIRIHSLYYTRNGTQDLQIESFMNYLSAVGQTVSPINLGAFKATTDSKENPFCKLLAVDKSVVYRTNKIFAVNTSAKKVGLNLKIDTDEDGITDEDELLFGSDANNSRSIAEGVLDGICKLIGGKEQCLLARSQITCDSTKINALRMSDCDIKILKLDKLAVYPTLAGIDSDNDGIPDFIEILKGTNPISNDSYLDSDGDGLTNMQEISMGLDPFKPDTEEKPVVSSDSQFSDIITGCTSGGWNLNINYLGGIAGKNNLMFFFRTESKNTSGVFEYRIFNTGYQVNKSNNQILDIHLNKNYIGINDFELVTNGVSP